MDNNALKEIAEQKEKEWRLIQEQRIDVLEKTLNQKTNELKEEKTKFNQLKEDFKFNLKLLEERDSELEKFEQTLTNVRKQLSDKNAEISELKIKIDDFKKLNDTEKTSIDELKKYYITRLNQKNSEFEKFRSLKDNEISQERAEIEKLKRDLQMQIKDLEFDLDRQRDEMKNEFDQLMKKREHEYRIQIDEFNTVILAKDLEIKMLRNELSYTRDDYEKVKNTTETNENTAKNLERKLKEKEWELRDTLVLKDAKIKDLEVKLEQFDNKNKSIIDELTRKNQESSKFLYEKDLLIEKLKCSLSEEKLKIVNLNQQLEEYREIRPRVTDTTEELDKLRQKLIDSEKEIISLNEEIEKLRAKTLVKNDTEDKFKLEIDFLKSRCNELETEKVSLNSEWIQKYHHLENLKIEDSDFLNKSLQESRDQALAQVKRLEEKLIYKENVIKSILSTDPLGTHVNEIQDLSENKFKDENEKLKSIIRQMRQEIESIESNEVRDKPATVKFNEDLEKQLIELKHKNRELQSKIDEYVVNQKIPDDKLTDNTILNSHLKQLNETINLLRKEKVDLTTYCKKQQTKLIYLEKQINEENEKERHKQNQIETLKYELTSQERRLNTEITNLKTIIQNLGLELQTTRREADEYHKITIEKNSEISSLEHKISELNLKLSTSGQTINFGAQELFIEQLKEEIKRISNLNQQLQIKARQLNHENLRLKQAEQKSKKENVIDESDEETEDEEIDNLMNNKKEIESLKNKLKTAAKYINNLIEEKEHLIELSNQLRGELNRVKFDNENLALIRANRENELLNLEPLKMETKMPPRPKTQFTSRLEQLEKKQYELTKQQLTQQKKTKSDPDFEKQLYKVNNYTDSTVGSTDETITSSVKSENLKELWKILDNKPDDSIITNELKPQVKKVAIINSKSPSLKPKTPRLNSKPQANKPKIRNYNLKE
ncbi:unnamed protein product [Brachionus calyciflorus]|uniref:Uncharacterized protein n=1 Tax=Brachionus calyciflorus TaxID=104777 RepID=A0A813RYQ2_9BILA|nr:unnamed protein product [Brachionus calyciflorus]